MNPKSIVLKENDSKAVETAMNQEIEKAVKHFDGELIKIRTGRAHPTLVEDIRVSVYGGDPMALKGLAAIAAPEARLITIQPWDESIIPYIEKAIKESDLGVTPAADGKFIRINLPEMSSSRREELIKILSKKTEEARVAVRNIRKDFNNLIRDGKKDKVISDDFFKRLEELIQKVTDNSIKHLESLAAKKEKEIATV